MLELCQHCSSSAETACSGSAYFAEGSPANNATKITCVDTIHASSKPVGQSSKNDMPVLTRLQELSVYTE